MFIGGTIFLASTWLGDPHARNERAPSSAIYNDDGELVMVDLSAKDLEHSFDDENDDGLESKGGDLSHRSDIVLSAGRPKELIFDRRQLAGLLGEDVGLRGRRVVFHRQVFERFVNTSTRVVQFELFAEVRLKVRFAPSSLYGTNAGLYSGSVDGDVAGKVRLFVSGSSAQGTFETSTQTFRLIDGGSGQHFVIEERRATSRMK